MNQNTTTYIKSAVAAVVNVALIYGLVAKDKADALGAAAVAIVTAAAGIWIDSRSKR
jgi:hypothetical protein